MNKIEDFNPEVQRRIREAMERQDMKRRFYATDWSYKVDEIYAKYRELKSIHKTGVFYGVSGSTISKLFRVNKKRMFCQRWSREEVDALKNYYASVQDSEFSVEKVAEVTGHTYNAVALKASRLKLSVPSRDKSTMTRDKMSISQKLICTPEKSEMLSSRFKHYLSQNPHPKGMEGKKHSADTKRIISIKGIGRIMSANSILKSMKTRCANGTLHRKLQHGNWKSGWRTIGDQKIYARSRWEANYARYLQFLKDQSQIISWEHEPQTFWFMGIKRGCCSYLPDFRIVLPDRTHEWHEVKGWMDDRSRTKISRMRRFFPAEKLIIIDKDRYNGIMRTSSGIIKDWEFN